MYDKKFKSIEEQVELVEKYIPSLRNKVSDLTSKRSTEKKCMDKIVTLLTQYARSQTVSNSLKFNVEEFGRVLDKINQHLGVLLEGLENNVVEDLAEFRVRSKHLRSDLKTARAAADQERIRHRQLQRLQLLRDQEHERISAAEAELLKAKAHSYKATRALEQNADIFEQKKLQGLRSALLTWTTLELRYHARALELFTDAYRAAVEIDLDSDLEEFRGKMQSWQPSGRLATVDETTRQHEKVVLQTREHVDSLLGGTPTRWPSGKRSNSRQSNASSTYLENSHFPNQESLYH